MDATPPFTLRGPVDPAPFLPRAELPPWLWLVAAATLLALLLLIHALRSRRPTPDGRKVRAACHQAALRELEAIPRDLAPAPLATALSLALRRYLAATCDDRALFESHEETLARSDCPASLPEPLRHEVARSFASLASFKYAHDAPPPADDLIAGTRALIDRIHAALQA